MLFHRLRRLPYKRQARLDAQVQLRFSVNAGHALMVPAEGFHVAQVQETQPEAAVAMILGHP